MLESREATAEENARAGLVHRVYLPERKRGKLPAVVLVHGRAGNEQVMWVFTKALSRLKPVVVAPRAIHEDPLGGHSWWLLEHPVGETSPAPRSTRAEDLQAPLGKLENFVLSLEKLYNVDPSRVVVAGFSQGGALGVSLSLFNPQLFTGVAMLSSFIPSAVRAELDTGHIEHLPSYFIAHGTEDATIPFERALESRKLLESLGAKVEFHQDAVAHKVGAKGVRALGEWCERLLLKGDDR